MEKFRVSVFPIKTKDSIGLVNGIINIFCKYFSIREDYSIDNNFEVFKKTIANKGIDLIVYNRFINDIGQLEFLESCLNDDIVILDATREGENNSINNFDIANEHPKHLDHIWVVSRNYLPINFYGIDNGGYPDYKTGTKSNSEILEWMSKKISKIDFSKSRDNAEKGFKGWHKAAERSRNNNYLNKNISTNIFISFRTKYQYQETIILGKKSFEELSNQLPSPILLKLRVVSNKAFNAQTNDFENNLKKILLEDYSHYISIIKNKASYIRISDLNSEYKYSVNALSQRISNGIYHNGESKSIKYLEDGSLVFASELNTKQRTWQLLSIIDRDYIMHCDELWIYGSDDYLDTWWTRSELLIYAFLMHQKIDKRINKAPRRLMLYNPIHDTVTEIDCFRISDYIAQRVTRIQSNCAPDVMGFESVKSLRMMRNILYGNSIQQKKSSDEYFEIIIKNILPNTLKEQGMDNDSIIKILNDEDSIQEIKSMLESQFSNFKNQLKSGNFDPEMKDYYQSMISLQNEQLPDGMQDIVTEEDIVKTGLSEEYLKDEVFSEEFWETVIFQKQVKSNSDSIEEKLNIFRSEINGLLDFSLPKHIEIGNINELDNGQIDQIDGQNIIRKPSRFLFMPSRAGNIDLSPSKNNLLELPVFIVEN